jgi:nicotinamide-nucleotide amidase
MQAEILAFGTELLMGEIVDTNSAHIASRLPALGVKLQAISIVGDEMEELVGALRRGLARSDIIFTTGGLGPTADDLTREAIAEALNEPLERDPQLVADLEQTYLSRGTTMPLGNLKQATRIPSVEIISNPRGTAPGWWSEKDGRIIVAMPGVPAELEYMWEHQVTPRILERDTGLVITSRNLKTFGLGEAAVGDQVQHLFGRGNPYLGIYPRQDGIHLRIIAQGETQKEVSALIEPLENEIRMILGPLIWGTDNETAESRVGAELEKLGFTIAVMESCTGGLMASSITDIPGSSNYFRGGIVSYTNDSKSAYGVDPELIRQHGAVSSQVAEAMAQGIRQVLGSDIGVGITGVAGPDPLEGIEPGTVYMAVAWKNGARSTSNRFLPNRPLVKRRAVTQTLLEVHTLLQELAKE